MARVSSGRPRSSKAVVVRPPTARAIRKKESRASYQSFATSYAQFIGVGEATDEATDQLIRKYGGSTAWVYIAVNRIANATGQIPFQLIKSTLKGRPNSVVQGPATGLRELLLHPNPYQSWYDFIDAATVYLELTGNAYIEKAAVDRFGRPTELYLLSPARTRVIPGPKGPNGYVYDVNSNPILFKNDEIIHLKYSHPYSDWYGMGPLRAAALAIDIDRGAIDWNRNFMSKGAWPAGAIETDNDISSETATRLKAEIKKIAQRGKESAGQILLLAGGLKYHTIALGPKDVDWLDARRMSRDEILGIFGVPFAVAGLSSNEATTAKSAGVAQQVVNFYLFTVFPKIERIYGALNRELIKLFPGQLELVPDYRNIPALKDDVQKELYRSQAFRTLVASGWSLNMALAELYPHQPATKWGDVAWMNQAMIPISGPENPYAKTASQTPQPDTTVPTDSPTAPNPPASSDAAKRMRDMAHKLGINSGADEALAEIAARYPLVDFGDEPVD